MGRILIFFLIGFFSCISYSQWKTEMRDDGFSKIKLIYSSKTYVDPENTHPNKSAIAISGKNLIFLSNAMSSNGSCYVDIKFKVKGVQKYHMAYGSPSTIQTKIHGIRDCIFLTGYLQNEFLEDFLNASEIMIKTDCKSHAFEPVYFISKLNPVETQKAWDYNLNGEFFKENNRIAKENDKKQKENQKIKEINEKKDHEIINKINSLIDKNELQSANELLKTLYFSHPEIENKVGELIAKQKLEKIQTYLTERNIDRATETYNQLKTPNIKIKEQIIDSIISYYSDKGIENESEEFQKEIIDENIPILLNLEKGKYKVFIDKNGTAKVENYTLQSVRTFKLKKLELNGFKVNVSNYFFINIKTDTIFESTTYYCLSDKKPVYKTLDDKFYYKVKNSPAQEVTLLIDMMIPKNVIKITKNYQTETYANAIPIKQRFFSAEEPKFIPILKKD
jgi:hypothetical protein